MDVVIYPECLLALIDSGKLRKIITIILCGIVFSQVDLKHTCHSPFHFKQNSKFES